MWRVSKAFLDKAVVLDVAPSFARKTFGRLTLGRLANHVFCRPETKGAGYLFDVILV